jgi:hypothetical protein
MANQEQKPAADLRAFILHLASTRAGYTMADGKDFEAYPHSSKLCERMINVGQVIKAKKKGQRARFFTTTHAALAYLALPLPEKQSKAKNPEQKIAINIARLELVTRKAATPEGFATTDNVAGFINLTRFCQTLAGQGALIVAKPRPGVVRYFNSQAGADTFTAANLIAPIKPKQVRNRAPMRLHITRQPPKPATRRDAEIIWPVGVKHTIMPTLAPRNTTFSHSFLHGSMGVMR